MFSVFLSMHFVFKLLIPAALWEEHGVVEKCQPLIPEPMKLFVLRASQGSCLGCSKSGQDWRVAFPPLRLHVHTLVSPVSEHMLDVGFEFSICSNN